MANYQVLSLDTATPQIKAPGTGNGYSFDSGATNLGTWTTSALNLSTPLTLTTALASSSGGTGLTGFTANGVVYASSSSALTTGSALTFDGTNLVTTRLLAGRPTPDANNWAVQTYATSAYASGMSFTYGGVGAAAMWVPAGNALAFGADGASGTTELMRVNNTGLGIGTSSPAAKLDVAGSANLGAAGTDTVTLTGQVSANSSVGSAGQVLTSQGANLSPKWTTISGGLTLITTLVPTAGASSVTLTNISSYKSLLIMTDSGVALSSAVTLRIALSSDNGSTYGSVTAFTSANATNPYGYIQFFRTDNSSSNKPYFTITGSSTASYARVASPTGTVNALEITPNSGATFSGGGNIFVYGIN